MAWRGRQRPVKHSRQACPRQLSVSVSPVSWGGSTSPSSACSRNSPARALGSETGLMRHRLAHARDAHRLGSHFNCESWYVYGTTHKLAASTSVPPIQCRFVQGFTVEIQTNWLLLHEVHFRPIQGAAALLHCTRIELRTTHRKRRKPTELFCRTK